MQQKITAKKDIIMSPDVVQDVLHTCEYPYKYFEL